VVDQGEALGRLAAEHASASGAAPEGIWALVGAALGHPVRLKLVGEIRRLASWLGEAERLAGALGLSPAGVGEAGSGVLWLALAGPARADSLDRGLVRPLRERLAGEGGSLVVERAPQGIKSALDVWGPVAPEALAIMERLKREFDPEGILNPGRFVGGL
jgi:glycolate oxidase FAD binding subunit